MAKSCLIPTPEIEVLAGKFKDETPNSIANLIGVWQEQNNSSQMPSFEQLIEFKEFIRKKNISKVENALSRQDINPTNYKPNPLSSEYNAATRKARVNLIAQMFSDEVDAELSSQRELLQKQVDSTESDRDRSIAKYNLDTLTRKDIINNITPEGLLSRVKAAFESGVDENVWLDEVDEDTAKYYAKEYQKVVDYFDWFKPEVAQVISITENAMMYPNQLSATVVDLSDMNLLGDTDQEASDQYTREEEYKDNWMEQVKFINPITSLSTETRNILRQIIDVDQNGNELTDDIGNPKFLSPERAHYVLIHDLSNMTKANHLMKRLNNLAKRHKWVDSLIFMLETDPKLQSKFYNDFRKDFHEMRVLVREDGKNGTYSWKLVTLNKSGDIYTTLSDWQYDLEDRRVLDDNSIYNNRGEIIKDNVASGIRLINDLKSQLHNKSTQGKASLINDDNFFSNIISLFNRIGIGNNPAEIKTALENVVEIDGLEQDAPIDNMLNLLTLIYQGVNKNPGIKAQDLLSEYRTPYTAIARIIQNSKEDEIQSGAREGGKTRYSFVVPSYFGKMIKELKGIHGKEEFNQYIDKEFKQYDWFYNKETNEWLNPWIEDIVNDPNVRQKLDFHELISANVTKGKKEYADWSQLDYQTILLQEYFIDGVKTTSNKPFAYYHVPIMSDSQTAEFIHFKRYTNNTGGTNELGEPISYQEQLLGKMEKLVVQEINRMALVQEREVSSALPIVNYDISRDENGKIKSGGYNFKFIPRLNTLKDNYFLGNNKLFIDNFFELRDNSDPRLRDFIKASIAYVNEERFNHQYEHWENIGLFERTENGDFVYLPFGIKDDAQIKEILREYSWNTAFATSQIIELTTTDLAFYKDENGSVIDNFQKRYKEIEGATNKPNVNSEYSKKQQRSVYLKDQDDFVSDALTDISDVLDRRVSDGLMTKTEKSAVLNKFKNINVTDAQAYMTLDSYRSFMDMFGRWTDEHQRAFDNFKSNTWNYADFSVLFQPIKPFVYTQTNVKPGVRGYSDIKVPVQHKNAVFLLLAAHDLIANSEGKSQKLKALNQWMIDKNIDVVQFESAVKVGAQGMVDINNVDSYDDIYNALEQNRLIDGIENTDVVHIIDYEDVGIQVELPQHTIDTQILFGTQFRALIMSDLPVNAVFNIGEKQFTKGELIRLYNELLVENIAISAQNVDEIFANPFRLNEEIQNELRGNPRFEMDLLEAVQLKEDGNPVLPYYEAANSLRIQSLTGAIEKNRIIRQKIKGGAYVQVSNFGLVDDLRIEFEGEGDNRHVVYWEVYMPYWTKKFFPKEFFDNGNMDISKIPIDLREAIGFRIPTENKYSMPPLRIKGFLPQSSGDTIMMPADVTTVLGSDFDVDKLYVMMPEFDVKNNQIQKVQYDYSKPASEQSLAARNNALLDVMRSILTNPKISEQSLIPGNYDLQKYSASIITLAQQLNESELRKLLNIDKDTDMLSSLKRLSLKKIEALAKSVRDKLDPLDVTTQLSLHERNMTGAKMIGIVANHKKSHALMQFTNLAIKEDNLFNLNGKRLSSLHNILTEDKKAYISDSLAGFLASSVDNGKDPVLGFMGLNGFTMDTAMLLSRLGHTQLEVSLFMSQPIIRKMSSDYNKGERNVIDKTIQSKLQDSSFDSREEAEAAANAYSFDNNIMFDNIIKNRENIDNDLITAITFAKMNKVANDLARITRIKVDAQDGGIGQVSNTLIAQNKIYELFNDAISNKAFTLSDADIIRNNLGDGNMHDVKSVVMDSYIPYFQMFYSGGLEADSKRRAPYFYQYNDTMRYIHSIVNDMAAVKEISTNILNKIFNDYVAFTATGFRFFGQDGEMTIRDKRENMMRYFPEFFNEVVSSNSSISNLKFIKSIRSINAKGIPFKVLSFDKANMLTPNQKQDMKTEWTSLVYNENEQIRRLATGLVNYYSFRNGFGFSANSAMNMASTPVKIATPQYIDIHNALMNNDLDSATQFVEQFFRNHLDDRTLVEYLPKESSIKLAEGNSILDIVTIPENDFRRNLGTLIKELYVNSGEVSVVPKQYFSIPYNNETLFYKLVDMTENGAVYQRIYPLGVKNQLIEYEYGEDANDVISIIENNNPALEDTIEPQYSENEDIVETVSNDSNYIKTKETDSMYADDLNDVVLNSVYGTTVVPGDENIPNNKRSLSEYEPNKKWRDKDGLEIC